MTKREKALSYLNSIGIKEGSLVEFKGSEFTFQGICVNSSSTKKSGLYYSLEDEDFIAVEHKKNEETNNIKNFFETINDTTSHISRKPPAEIKETSSNDLIQKSDPSNSVANENGLLYFQVEEEDNIIVKKLKEFINAKKMKTEIITACGYNYNVQYSLKKRNSIDFKTLEKWLDILGVDLEISFVPKKKKG
jgi:hypothetical protein